jgi:hypothetical protein
MPRPATVLDGRGREDEFGPSAGRLLEIDEDPRVMVLSGISFVSKVEH